MTDFGMPVLTGADSTNGQELVDRIRVSADWSCASSWGEPRPGHPEGTVGAHVNTQVLPFIQRWYAELPDYWDLVALAYLHDIGKPETKYKNGRLLGESHSVISARIAGELGAGDRLVQVILSNDRAHSHWRKMQDACGVWQPGRWTEERSGKFVEEFCRPNLDLALLVLFHRADNAYRRPPVLAENIDPVTWFETQLLEQGLLRELPSPGKNQRLTAELSS
jgi:hypothetical protein